MIPPFKQYEAEPDLNELFTDYYPLQFVQNENAKFFGVHQNHTVLNFQLSRSPIPPGVTTATITVDGMAIQTLCAKLHLDSQGRNPFILTDIGLPRKKIAVAHLDGKLGIITTIWTYPVPYHKIELIVSYEYEWDNHKVWH